MFVPMLAHQANFLVTGVYSTLISQYLYNSGAANERSLLIVFFNYIAMSLAYFVPRNTNTHTEVVPLDDHTSIASADSSQLSIDSDGTIAEKTFDGVLLSSRRTPTERTFFPPKGHRMAVLLLSALEMAANTLLTLGLYLTGSGIYQVVYSSIVAFTAVISTLRIERTGMLGGSWKIRWDPDKMGPWEWGAIAVITVGLSFPAFDAIMSTTDDDVSREAASDFLYGVLLVLLGTLSYAFVDVISERLICPQSAYKALPPSIAAGIDPLDLCAWTGSTCAAASCVYLLLYTLPRWDEVVVAEVKARGGVFETIVAGFASDVASQFLHNVSYFHLIDKTGAVTTSVLQSLHSIMVFLLSAALYCDPYANLRVIVDPSNAAHIHVDPDQCLTLPKLASCFVVSAGVVLYGWAKNQKGRPAPARSASPHDI